jgi:cell division septum initiation protein DivIVA
MLTSAQSEAERRVGEATGAAERMLAQAGADAEETLTTARSEAEDSLREARAEAERLVVGAQQESDRLLGSAGAESERTLGEARAEAEKTLADAQQRVAALDEHAGRRVEYLTNTHTEVVRRLTEVSSVLSDLMQSESKAGPLVAEAAGPVQPVAQQDDVRIIVEDGLAEPEEAPAKPVVSDDTDTISLSDVRH